MYLTTLDQYINKNGKHQSETYRVEFFESDQQAIEEFEKQVHDDLYLIPGYRNSGVELLIKDSKQAKTIWNHTDGYVFCVKTYTITHAHPMTSRIKGF